MSTGIVVNGGGGNKINGVGIKGNGKYITIDGVDITKELIEVLKSTANKDAAKNYEYVQPINYCGDDGNTEVFIYKDPTGLTIDTEINLPRNTGNGVYVQQAVIAVLPDEEGIKLRDYLISIYPL